MTSASGHVTPSHSPFALNEDLKVSIIVSIHEYVIISLQYKALTLFHEWAFLLFRTVPLYGEFCLLHCPTVGHLPPSENKMSNARQIPEGGYGRAWN